jgi:hypothetical protein
MGAQTERSAAAPIALGGANRSFDVRCRFLLAAASLSFAPCPATGTTPLDWQRFEIPEFGTSLEYPATIFPPAGAAQLGAGRGRAGRPFEGQDGRTVLSVHSRQNDGGETPATYLKTYLPVNQSTLDYERVTRSFFAVSMERDGLIYYSRCNFSGLPAGVIHCFDLVYPQSEKRAWDPVVTRMSLSLRPRGD